MQPCRVSARVIPRTARVSNPTRTMFTSPFFPHFGGEIAPIFRALDSAVAPHLSVRRSFTPRFDVREIGSTYELQGELPGLEHKDLDIEFVDERTLVIRGKSVRETSSSHANSEETETKTQETTRDTVSEKSANYQKVSVDDEYVDADAAGSSKVDIAEPSGTKEVEAEPAFKYWVSERSVGTFERQFSFPGRVDQNAVKASLRNGILSVVVPKLVERQARRIEIQYILESIGGKFPNVDF